MVGAGALCAELPTLDFTHFSVFLHDQLETDTGRVSYYSYCTLFTLCGRLTQQKDSGATYTIYLSTPLGHPLTFGVFIRVRVCVLCHPLHSGKIWKLTTFPAQRE